MILKHSILIFVLVNFFAGFSKAQIYETVLDQGTEQSTTTPFYSYYGYSYNQSIYLASEFLPAVQGTPTEISSISLYNVSGNVNSTDDWTILIGQTTKTDFSNGSDWVNSANLDTVFQGTVTANGANSWMELTLDTPFLWDGVSNIVVGFRDQRPGYTFSQISWGTYDVANTRSITTRNDGTVPNLQNPPTAQNTHQEVPKIKFQHINYVDCQTQNFTGTYDFNVNQTTLCENEMLRASFDGLSYVNGLSFQWQELNGGSWVDIANADSTVYESTMSQTTDLRLKISCAASSTDFYTTNQLITVNSSPNLTVNFNDVAYCAGNPAAIIASGADTYAWSPSNGLSNSNTALVNASPSNITSYTVTGTSANGCTSEETVKVSPIDQVVIDYSISSSNLCSAPAIVDLDVINLPSLTGSSTWEYTFLDENNATLAAWSSANSISINATTDSVYKVKYQVRSTECPSIIYESTLKDVIVGFGTDVDVEHYNCINLGGSIEAVNDFGQSIESLIYDNDLTDPNNVTDIAFSGDAEIINGRAVITPSATSSSGAIVISPSNQVLGPNNSMNVSFDLTADLPINNWGTGGADGITYSFADDINVNANNPHNGSGSKLRLSFDSADNSPNIAGIYLIYGQNNTNAPNPNGPNTLAYEGDISIWKDKTDIPVEFSIVNGLFSLTVNGTLVFDNVQLPNSYLTENTTSWEHAFSAGTGGDAMRHAVKNFSISTKSYEFGITTDATNAPTQWQSHGAFNNVQPATYYLWMRKDAASNCQKMVKEIDVINTNPVVDLGGNYNICEGDSLELDAQNPTSSYIWNGTNIVSQTRIVFDSGIYTVQVTDTLGCIGIGSTVVEVEESPNISGVDVVQQSTGVTVFNVQNAQNGYTYDWDFGDGNTINNGASSVNHFYATSGTYNAMVTVSNNCGDTTITREVVITSTLGLTDDENGETLKVYPNPTSDLFTVELGNTKSANISIYNTTSELVEEFNDVIKNIKVDTRNWSRGVYLVHISSKTKKVIKKLIVQ
ncbi:T9SS type A sorting domain-containing protein [Brumimicrobium aurantiacum]|uniref:T9SS C-terminal target domain-containing protein n=1 Tax=Brumimicrobium aurantiacum TaxID=1737063 RepID=A0A3E1F2C5_9FLAO|nr:T9SS type A sorting domain-containing protein [Brumimicrobium aurantiacum]RFC55909.1 T9SS C-terminal target domain-containing protein [Brumimicrobium aurantiacum]